MATPERVAILGSTGSIGRQTLAIIRDNRERFSVYAISGFSNIDALREQTLEFQPSVVVVRDSIVASMFEAEFPEIDVLVGPEGLIAAATAAEVSIVVGAIVGFACLAPVLAAVRAGKQIALANKECLVGAGELVMREVNRAKGVLVPVDSEHNSIAQCMLGQTHNEVDKITLTASGGPFLSRPLVDLKSVTPSEAIKHPRWSMGAKISIDSATLMNKGLEVIEAFHLFALQTEQIAVLIHPESIVHGMVHFKDGAVLACLYSTDMRVPISYALGHCSSSSYFNGRVSQNGVRALELTELSGLHFYQVDNAKFPALNLCYEALRSGGCAPLVLNASNEIAVNAFLEQRIGFLDIIPVVRETLSRFQNRSVDSLEMINEADRQARVLAEECLQRFMQ